MNSPVARAQRRRGATQELDKRQQARSGRRLQSFGKAAAGIGKTAVLTERIVRLVAAGTDITAFCRDVHGSRHRRMKRRISRSFFSREEADEASAAPEAGARLRTQALSVGHANISTLPRFCLYVLRRTFPRHGAGSRLSPGGRCSVRHATEQQAPRIRPNRAMSRKTPAFWGCYARWAATDKAVFPSKELYGFLLASPDPGNWLDLGGERGLVRAAKRNFCNQAGA
jgi:hypothetical protein